MSIEIALKSWLESDPNVQDMTQGRIYPDKRPQSTTGDETCVVFWKTSRGTLKNLSGLSGISNPRFAIECRAKKYGDATTLADLIRGNKNDPKLDGFRGLLGGEVFVQSCKLVDDGDQPEPPVHGEEMGNMHVTQEYEIYYEDTGT